MFTKNEVLSIRFRGLIFVHIIVKYSILDKSKTSESNGQNLVSHEHGFCVVYIQKNVSNQIMETKQELK